MSPTIKDVARLAGVSSATVSRVLHDRPHVRPELRRRVTDAIEKLDYQPSRVAQSLRVQRSRIIGVIISDIQNPFFTSLVRAAEDTAHEAQYAVFLCNSDEDLNKESLYVDLMLAEQVSGVIICPTHEKENPARRLIEAGIPVVAVDRRMESLEVDTVLVNNQEATKALTEHMIEAGHRQFGAIIGVPEISTGRERYEGFHAALRKHGIVPDRKHIFSVPPKEEQGYLCARKLLSLPDRPTAILAGNNLLGVGVLRAVQEAGLQLSRDVTVAVFDDECWASLVTPAINTVSQPTYELGRTAAEMLLKRIAQPDHPIVESVLKCKLMIREPQMVCDEDRDDPDQVETSLACA
jgi:DNA-binding LacI/PurR family transcriptional regulator